jgi:hypothetical protein
MMGQGDRAERLLEAGLALSSELSLPVILQRIVDLAGDLTGGQGFDPATARPGGQGLGNLRARALGGQVEIDSHQGEGTRVRVQLTRPSPPT